MDKQEWMPTNPCKVAMCDPIPNDDCEVCSISESFYHYQSEVAAQKKLLEYQLEYAALHKLPVIWFKNMLKELEGK